MKSFQSAGDIDAAELIKIAQQINYELGLRIYSWKETMIEVDNGRARLPADFHQMQLALICHHYTHIQNAPWNGNVLLEQIAPNDCNPNTNNYTGSNCCDICNVTHEGSCPNIVVNPYPLGKTRTICAGTDKEATIKILRYCQSEIQCYEQFSRLYIVPHRQASAFSNLQQFGNDCNQGSIYNGYLEVNGIECTKVYIAYLGALEDDDGNLLVLDHPVINKYYSWYFKEVVLENLYLNGEALIERVKYATAKKEEYLWRAMSIVNTPNFRDTIKYLQTLKAEHDRNYWHPISRYWGHLGYVNQIDVM